MKKFLLSSAAMAAFFFAIDAEAKRFHGPFLGLNAGYTSGDIEAGLAVNGVGTVSGEEDLSGFEAGVFGGYRHQFDSNFVLGAEIGATWSNADGSFNNIQSTNVDYEFEKNNEFYLSVKPGYAPQDDLLLYLIGGYQRADFEDNVVVGGTSLGGEDETFDGYHFGAGAEYAPMKDVSLRLEYKYQDYQDETFTVPGASSTYEGDENVFRVGLVFQF